MSPVERRGLPMPGRCAVVGVLNVTPDSFSDGGRYQDLDAALAHGMKLWHDGADMIDVGGESTRPGADRVRAEEETRRVLPAVRALASAGVLLSIDTTRAAVAAAALEAGAAVVNDVSGGLADPDMYRVVADAGVPCVLMHWRGHSRDMRALANYDDVVAEVTRELSERVDDALKAGVDAGQLAIDPGLGFAKLPRHDWALLAHLDALLDLGLPVLVAASRKSFLGTLLVDGQSRPRPVGEREDATVAVSVAAALAGVWGVRVHEVRANLDAVRVVAALRAAGAPGGGTRRDDHAVRAGEARA